MATFLQIQQRYLDLIGDDTASVADDKGKRHINRAIGDILNKYSFSWDIASDTLTVSGGVASLPTDYNPLFGVLDARIDDQNIFTRVAISDKNTETANIYWITYDTTTNRYIFNTNTDGSVIIYYNFIPADLSGDSEVCLVPDIEAVAYLAASKNWIGDERNVELKREYEQMADRMIQALYIRDLEFGPVTEVGTIVDYNSGLLGSTTEFEIYKPY